MGYQHCLKTVAPTVSNRGGLGFCRSGLDRELLNHTDTSCPANPASATLHEAGLQPAIAVKTAPTVSDGAGLGFCRSGLDRELFNTRAGYPMRW